MALLFKTAIFAPLMYVKGLDKINTSWYNSVLYITKYGSTIIREFNLHLPYTMSTKTEHEQFHKGKIYSKGVMLECTGKSVRSIVSKK